MLRYTSYDIVFQEIPGEVTLAVNLSGCPHRCPGCHSPWLWQDTGEPLNEESLGLLLDQYGEAVSCVCFMGGDADPEAVARLAAFARHRSAHTLKTGWYSGNSQPPPVSLLRHFNYLKTGPYIEQLGGLTSPTTNQRFYAVENGRLTDRTHLFRRISL
ncbi:MAG: anaerobic ribonucleoside-triphosphate reductase activating protein [Culturomica sp.]|jgi:anaerobic ribonucleoside-triphosphate reductase activating protein|nr:anaerobic ribonucleoside-triphosphate reductase activating protein [Culturomica sp.]